MSKDQEFCQPQPDLSDSAKAEIIECNKARYRLAIALEPDLKNCKDDWWPAPDSVLMNRAAELLESKA